MANVTVPGRTWMVFDVESVGLHGEGFAVGWTVVDGSGLEIESAKYVAPVDVCLLDSDAGRWLKEHCGHLLTHVNASDCRWMRWRFWQDWLGWRKKGATLAADCPWPVEARFLARCVDDAFASNEWSGPYPLIDVASVRLAAGLNPLGTEERLAPELPAHDPLADARQSARLLVEALRKTGAA